MLNYLIKKKNTVEAPTKEPVVEAKDDFLKRKNLKKEEPDDAIELEDDIEEGFDDEIDIDIDDTFKKDDGEKFCDLYELNLKGYDDISDLVEKLFPDDSDILVLAAKKVTKACILYLKYEEENDDFTFYNVRRLLTIASPNEDYAYDDKTDADRIFDDLGKKFHGENMAVELYREFKLLSKHVQRNSIFIALYTIEKYVFSNQAANNRLNHNISISSAKSTLRSIDLQDMRSQINMLHLDIKELRDSIKIAESSATLSELESYKASNDEIGAALSKSFGIKNEDNLKAEISPEEDELSRLTKEYLKES